MNPSDLPRPPHRFGEYSPVLAMELCQFCADTKIPTLGDGPGRWVRDLAHDRCMILDRPDYIAVLFRSSDNSRNWISNLNASRVDAAQQLVSLRGAVHRGFLIAVEQFEGFVLDTVTALQNNASRPRPVYFAGHSRGGPLAMLAAALFQLPYVLGVYTYGAPRWCDKVAAREYDFILGRATHKHVRNNDIVPNLPPWRLGWQHVGRLNYIDRRGRLHRDVHSLPLWDRVLGAVEDIGRPGLDAFKDHSGDNLDSYLLPLEEAVGVTRDEFGVS